MDLTINLGNFESEKLHAETTYDIDADNEKADTINAVKHAKVMLPKLLESLSVHDVTTRANGIKSELKLLWKKEAEVDTGKVVSIDAAVTEIEKANGLNDIQEIVEPKKGKAKTEEIIDPTEELGLDEIPF